MEEITIDDLATYKSTMAFISANTVVFLFTLWLFMDSPKILAIFFVLFFAANVAAFQVGKMLSQERLK